VPAGARPALRQACAAGGLRHPGADPGVAGWSAQCPWPFPAQRTAGRSGRRTPAGRRAIDQGARQQHPCVAASGTSGSTVARTVPRAPSVPITRSARYSPPSAVTTLARCGSLPGCTAATCDAPFTPGLALSSLRSSATVRRRQARSSAPGRALTLGALNLDPRSLGGAKPRGLRGRPAEQSNVSRRPQPVTEPNHQALLTEDSPLGAYLRHEPCSTQAVAPGPARPRARAVRKGSPRRPLDPPCRSDR
jgi:hypothetical protein